MSAIFMLAGLVLAAALVLGGFQTRSMQVRIASVAAGCVVLIAGFVLASFRYVGEDEVGVVIKNIGWTALPPGKIIATEGETGPQATTLAPGWRRGYYPFIYDIEYSKVIEIPAGQVGLLTATDGEELPDGTVYAPEWPDGEQKRMAQDARYFLTDGGGYRGPQTSVLKPGTHRINPKLFKVKLAPITTVEKAQAGVIKSNVGEQVASEGGRTLVERGQRGIWRQPLLEGQYYLNSDAYEVTIISTQKQIINFTASEGERHPGDEEREITVRTSDGFTFPVDVRIVYEVRSEDAPLLVATVRDDQAGLRSLMYTAVRDIFRNNAERVKALDYVQQRGEQGKQSQKMLQEAMKENGVTITGVRIGNVGDAETLGSLLKTQTDREIALQQQKTFQVQQEAAEQKKKLTRTEQEAEEEKRLATASYEVQIAEQDRQKRVIGAEAEAKAIQIQAEAQAEAYKLIAEQIGSTNAALVEVLKIVGERGISITPRVMVVGQGTGGTGDGQTTALIGTMLDTMVDKSPRPASE